MNLHNEIMNIPARPLAADLYDHKLQAYKCGHRDARHDAADLSLKYERYIKLLENHLEDFDDLLDDLRKEAGLE